MAKAKTINPSNPAPAEAGQPKPDPFETEVVGAEHRAASAALSSIARREAKTLRALGARVDVPGGDPSGVLPPKPRGDRDALRQVAGPAPVRAGL